MTKHTFVPFHMGSHFSDVKGNDVLWAASSVSAAWKIAVPMIFFFFKIRSSLWRFNLIFSLILFVSGFLKSFCSFSQVIPTKDRMEGLLAFKEKRKPKYQGH